MMQLSFQPLSVNAIRRLSDSPGDTVVPVRVYSAWAPAVHRGRSPSYCAALRNFLFFVAFNIPGTIQPKEDKSIVITPW